MQALINMIYPNQCVVCDAEVQSQHSLCPACWPDVPFITADCCHYCGIQLPGEVTGPTPCDICLHLSHPWDAGRAAMMYGDAGRKLVLGLKHADRHDLVPTLAGWMVQKIKPLLQGDEVFVPVPLHWRRMISRKYNQSALLTKALARHLDAPIDLRALRRNRHTKLLDGHGVDERFSTLSGAISVGKRAKVKGRNIVLVDDVMTSGATFTECTTVLKNAGAKSVTVLALARAGKAP